MRSVQGRVGPAPTRFQRRELDQLGLAVGKSLRLAGEEAVADQGDCGARGAGGSSVEVAVREALTAKAYAYVCEAGLRPARRLRGPLSAALAVNPQGVAGAPA